MDYGLPGLISPVRKSPVGQETRSELDRRRESGRSVDTVRDQRCRLHRCLRIKKIRSGRDQNAFSRSHPWAGLRGSAKTRLTGQTVAILVEEKTNSPEIQWVTPHFDHIDTSILENLAATGSRISGSAANTSILKPGPRNVSRAACALWGGLNRDQEPGAGSRLAIQRNHGEPDPLHPSPSPLPI